MGSVVESCTNALKFGTQEGGVRAHLGTKFLYNTINTRKVICNYSWKMTSICYHAHRVNCEWQETENWYRGRLTIERTKGHKDIAKKPIVCKNYAIEKTNKMPLLPVKPLSRIN